MGNIDNNIKFSENFGRTQSKLDAQFEMCDSFGFDKGRTAKVIIEKLWKYLNIRDKEMLLNLEKGELEKSR